MTEPTDPAVPREVAIRCRDLTKEYRLDSVGAKKRRGRALRALGRLVRGRGSEPVPRFLALDGISFSVERGERVAIIGSNGAGKSTLLKLLSRIVYPTRGEAILRGRLTSLLEVGTGFNSALSGRENVYVNASIHGLTKRETTDRLPEIIEFSGIDPRFIDMRVKHYSSGMRMRLAFSVAAHLDPDILLLDEVLAVGDMAFQEKCLARVEGMMEHRRTVLFVSHDLSSVVRFCQRALWLESGRLVMDGDAKEVVSAYTARAREALSGRRGRSRLEDVEAEETSPGTEEPRIGAGGKLVESPAAKFHSVSLIDLEGRELSSASVEHPICIEFDYEVLEGGQSILPVARFYSKEEILLFTAVYTEAEYMQRPKSTGRYISVLQIPPHFFNPGPIEVSVSLTSPVSGKLKRHVVIEKALGFDVHEAPFGVTSARGCYRSLKGAVRPLFEWRTEVIS